MHEDMKLTEGAVQGLELLFLVVGWLPSPVNLKTNPTDASDKYHSIYAWISSFHIRK